MKQSRIGKMPVVIPEGVTVDQQGGVLTVHGPKGELKLHLHPSVTAKIDSGQVELSVKSENDKAFHGLTRALIANMVLGVVQGFIKELEMTGIGYRAAVEGRDLVLTVGFSHPVKIAAPEGIVFSVVEGKIIVTGIDKHVVGQIAAKVRDVRPPEPYKGKGIHYVGEYIRRKPGKAAKAATSGAGGTGGK